MDKTQKEKIREKIEEILPKKRTVGNLSIGFNVCLEEVHESLPKIIEQFDLAIKETEERLVREIEVLYREVPKPKELPEKYTDSLEINDETLPILTHNAMVMCYVSDHDAGYNQAIEDTINIIRNK